MVNAALPVENYMSNVKNIHSNGVLQRNLNSLVYSI